MSIDARAEERQEAVRGRVKEKPETEVDPTLPVAPSKFPLAPAITGAVLVTIGIGVTVYMLQMRSANELTEAQQRNVATVEAAQKAFTKLWDETPLTHRWFACRHLHDVVTRPCNPTVKPSSLEFEPAVLALSTPEDPSAPSVASACSAAALVFLESRANASCD
jgi:hypothetical protein